jgi:hypothetical protein
MSTFNGLPAHILLNHFIVVLAPLTAVLAILCALWPAARRRLIWLVLVLATATLILTPVTAGAGAWLAMRVAVSPAAAAMLALHERLGATLVYIVAALLGTVALLAAVHVRQARGAAVTLVVPAVVGVLVIVAAAATLIQTYRIGDSGARAAWGTVSSAAP